MASVPVIIFSAEDIRGAMLGKAFRQKGYEVSLFRNLHEVEHILRSRAPAVVVLDSKGYFQNELEHFNSLHGFLSSFPVIVISPSETDGKNFLKDISAVFCDSTPLDPLSVEATARKLLTGQLESRRPDDDTLADDVRGFLGIS